MLKRFEDRRWGLAVSVLVLVSLVLLAGALKQISFRAAQPIAATQAERIQLGTMTRIIVETIEIPFWKHLVFWGAALLVILLISTLLSPEMRRRLLAAFLRAAAFVLAFLYIMKNNPDLLASLFPKFNNSNDPARASAANDLLPPVFQAPHISNILSYLSAFIFVSLLAFILFMAARGWAALAGRRREVQPLTEVAGIVRASLKDLASGRNSTEVIIRCYASMSRAVDARRGLYRAQAMTPAEFGARLEAAGLPPEPVLRLTRLFEKARYGGRLSDAREEHEAVSCLSLILDYCGEGT